VASSDYTRDIVIGQPVLASINSSLLKYRTIIKMLLGSMHENAHDLPLTTLDKIALVQLDKAMVGVWEAWQPYEFQKAVNIINRWVNVELSAFYLDAIKDRLYCGDGGGVLFHVFSGLMQMLSPITPLLVEEAWEHRPEWTQKDP
jgi:isoleucyl-tRNA synthetase